MDKMNINSAFLFLYTSAFSKKSQHMCTALQDCFFFTLDSFYFFPILKYFMKTSYVLSCVHLIGKPERNMHYVVIKCEFMQFTTSFLSDIGSPLLSLFLRLPKTHVT